MYWGLFLMILESPDPTSNREAMLLPAELLPSCPVPLHGHHILHRSFSLSLKYRAAPNYFRRSLGNLMHCKYISLDATWNQFILKNIELFHLRENEWSLKEKVWKHTAWRLYQTLNKFFSSVTARVIALRDKMFSPWCQHLTAWWSLPPNSRAING